MKIKKMRTIKQTQEYLFHIFGIQYSYYQLKKMYEDSKVNCYRDGKTIYLYIEDVVNFILNKTGGNNYETKV